MGPPQSASGKPYDKYITNNFSAKQRDEFGTDRSMRFKYIVCSVKYQSALFKPKHFFDNGYLLMTVDSDILFYTCSICRR